MNKKQYKRYLAELKKLDKQVKPLIDAIRESQRITEKDLSVTVH